VSAYSGAEAKKLITEHQDVAIVFLDVIMETEDAGLEVVRYIRDSVNNHMVRIILRTGQPGQVPERDVIIEYDINDYKTKTELTARKFFTSVVSGLRAYSDLKTIEQNRLGLEQIIGASASIFKIQSQELFVQGVFTQLVSLLGLGENSFCCGSVCFAISDHSEGLCIIAGTGTYTGNAGRYICRSTPLTA
jgi:response regulator RpfG family c-di-GMP phosphodiesterase